MGYGARRGGVSFSVNLTFRGLAVKGWLDDYTPATREQPAEGGGCMEFDWEVADIGELAEALGLPTPGLTDMVVSFYHLLGKLPTTLQMRIEEDWHDAISEAAEEHFWGTMGGPSGYKDYCYDG